MIQVSLSSMISKQGHISEWLWKLLKCSTLSPCPVSNRLTTPFSGGCRDLQDLVFFASHPLWIQWSLAGFQSFSGETSGSNKLLHCSPRHKSKGWSLTFKLIQRKGEAGVDTWHLEWLRDP